MKPQTIIVKGEEISTVDQVLLNSLRAFRETTKPLDTEYIDYVNEEFWNLLS